MDTKARWFQVSLRTLLEIVAAVAVILALLYQRGGTTGRYQMIATPRVGGGSEVFMYDSATGKVWQQEYSNGSWTPATLPGLRK